MSRASPRFRRSNPSLVPIGTTNGCALYRIVGSIEGQMTVSGFYYFASVPTITQTQMSTLLAAIRANLRGNYINCISSDWSLTLESLALVHRNDVATFISTTGSLLVGARSAGHLSTEMTCWINRVSFVKGQHGRGRVSIPAIAAADATNSKISAAAEQTVLLSLASAMLTSASDGTNTWLPCIAQRATTSPKLVTATSQLSSATPNFLLGTVRRRRIGRGK